MSEPTVTKIIDNINLIKQDIQSAKQIAGQYNIDTTNFTKDLAKEVTAIPQKIKDADSLDRFCEGKLSLNGGYIYSSGKDIMLNGYFKLVKGYTNYTLPDIDQVYSNLFADYDFFSPRIIHINETTKRDTNIFNMSTMTYIYNTEQKDFMFTAANSNLTFNIKPLEEDSIFEYESGTLTINDKFTGIFGLPFLFSKLNFNGNQVTKLVLNYTGIFNLGTANGITEIVVGPNVKLQLPPAYAYGAIETMAKQFNRNPVTVRVEKLENIYGVLNYGNPDPVSTAVNAVWHDGEDKAFNIIVSDDSGTIEPDQTSSDTNRSIPLYNASIYNSDKSKMLSIRGRFESVDDAKLKNVYDLIGNITMNVSYVFRGFTDIYKPYRNRTDSAESMLTSSWFSASTALYNKDKIYNEFNCILPSVITEANNNIEIPLNSCIDDIINIDTSDLTLNFYTRFEYGVDNYHESAYPLSKLTFRKKDNNFKIKVNTPSGDDGYRVFAIPPEIMDKCEFIKNNKPVTTVELVNAPLFYNKNITEVTVGEKLLIDNRLIELMVSGKFMNGKNDSGHIIKFKLKPNCVIEQLHLYNMEAGINPLSGEIQRDFFDKFIRIEVESEYELDMDSKGFELPIYTADGKKYNYESNSFEVV